MVSVCVRLLFVVLWISKLTGHQLTVPSAVLQTLIGSLNGQTLTWGYFNYSHGYRIEMAGMQHSAFASMNLRKDAFADQGIAQPEYDREEAKVSFHAVAQYTLAFLNAYLKKRRNR